MTTPMYRTKKVPTKLAITSNDSKILGRTTSLRREKTTNDKVGTLKMRTYNSAWTPVVHKPSNEQIFKERRDLVSHWYDLWTDSQRKRFLDIIFHQSKRPQKKFVQDWFREYVPLQHLDFTSVLPRILSVYIFSFLEPKSLSRAAQVSWHWKFLTEQDEVWASKCLKYGWFLPYTSADNEYGAWKRHYIACVQTLDYVSGSGMDDLYGTRSDGSRWQNKKNVRTKPNRLDSSDSRRLMDVRPPWQGPDYKPQDLQKSHIAMVTEKNPNDPDLPKSALVLHNRWGIIRKQHETSVSKSLDFEIGLDTSRRRERHRLISGADYDPRKVNNRTLSEVIHLENIAETRFRELVETNGLPPNRTGMRRSDLSGGGGYPIRNNQVNALPPGGSQVMATPRIVFISSRVPAAELLCDAVMFGVIPIVYEYEGTSTETLMHQIDTVLQGRNAQSVGLFTHSDEPGNICLVHGCTVNINNYDASESCEFFETVANHILPSNMGGQLDVFAPLAASEAGMELMVQLSVLTGIQFSSPTGIIGSYNHVNTEWLIPYKDCQPTDKYFCPSKLRVWANVADQALEAITDCRQIMAPYFEKVHRDIAAQLTGQVMFDALGQTDIQGTHSITQALTDGLVALGSQSNVQPLEYLGQYLLEQAGVTEISMTTKADNLARTRQAERQNGAVGTPRQDVKVALTPPWTVRWNKSPATTPSRRMRMRRRTAGREVYDPQMDPAEKYDSQEKISKDEKNILRQQEVTMERKTVTLKTQDLRNKFGTMTTGTLRATKSQRLTSQQFTEHPEKRTPIAFEILTSEMEYNRMLRAVRDVYYKPLKSALTANRAIISSQNLHVIFTDVMAILTISRQLTEDLKNRLADWSFQHTCIGDIFVKFCLQLKAYTNFINNNEVILRAIERCKEQTPEFRAYLLRHQHIPETKMLTLQELLLQPSRRISEYVTLLSWFELHTPRNHADREDLANAIATMRELDKGIKEVFYVFRGEVQLVTLQKRIINCPALLEANRYLIKHQDVANLKPPEKDSAVPERRAYQHTEMLGLYLYNDALVVTRRTSKHFPFSRAVEYTYKFEASVGLTRLSVTEIPDSKYVKNGFKMSTPKREWVCSTELRSKAELDQSTREQSEGVGTLITHSCPEVRESKYSFNFSKYFTHQVLHGVIKDVL
ncbi:LOW QUALITY PROTEIN: epithelial cell-transforming sequence 2 oncogene-like [Haliotis rubra]|uniref:LOW QUALITY PROTEIN: epithelial cell-transforming sequence 2 oncogene-like n=1 Tax=Haliotis rubra TaxID=36100 RepID=UPI001EE53627|nr:LOW QUALITY PROTEIN: epithelial cell-transforming sequence 2 oncogene-like [Haliotis rubra]